jgi:resuscitation-promoting factor RpfA
LGEKAAPRSNPTSVALVLDAAADATMASAPTLSNGLPAGAPAASNDLHVGGDASSQPPRRCTLVATCLHSGDSLWRIAARHLGPDATTAKTAREVNRLWELNQQRIGTGNPDVIFPGQTLTM